MTNQININITKLKNYLNLYAPKKSENKIIIDLQIEKKISLKDLGKMIKKGIILAGGMGTRMSPLTKAVNKQLLPIYDKPLIFYPLSILMLAKIKDVLIIVNKGQLDQYKKIIPNGKNLGINITYKEQPSPKGLPDAFILGEKFIGKSNVALILGDNFFYGQSLTRILKKNTNFKNGAKVFLHPVKNPNLYGVATLNNKNKVLKLLEKPKKTKSNLAVTLSLIHI